MDPQRAQCVRLLREGTKQWVKAKRVIDVNTVYIDVYTVMFEAKEIENDRGFSHDIPLKALKHCRELVNDSRILCKKAVIDFDKMDIDAAAAEMMLLQQSSSNRLKPKNKRLISYRRKLSLHLILAQSYVKEKHQKNMSHLAELMRKVLTNIKTQSIQHTTMTATRRMMMRTRRMMITTVRERVKERS